MQAGKRLPSAFVGKMLRGKPACGKLLVVFKAMRQRGLCDWFDMAYDRGVEGNSQPPPPIDIKWT